MAVSTNKRVARKITNKDEVDFFLNLSQKDVESLSKLMETFGTLNGKAPKYNTYDIITIPPNSYGIGNKKNKNAFTTTLGRWWFNKCFIEQDLFDLFHYINKPINKDVLGDMNDQISYAIMEDRLPLSALKRYLMRQQKFQPYCNILCSGFTTNMLTISYKIDKMKKQLEKKYADELADPERNMYAADKIEKELLDYAKKELKDDISMDMYDSKAKGSFANNFKNIFVMKGAIKDPDPTKGYDVAMSSYIDGISRDDYSKLAKALAAGPYSRSKKTPEGGYNEKLLLRAFQHITLAPKGTDCGTKRTIEITLDKYNIKLMMYSYIVEGNKLIELNSTNKDKYLGKTVRMRFSSLCEYKEPNKICNVCAGNLFYRAGYKDIGVAIPQVASALKLKALKAFHDSTVKLHEIDVWKAFGLKK